MNTLLLKRAVLVYASLSLVTGILNCMEHPGLSMPSKEAVKAPLHSLFFDWKLIYRENFNCSGCKTAVSLDRTTLIVIDSKKRAFIDTANQNGPFAESFCEGIEGIVLSAQGAIALVLSYTKACFWSTALNQPLGDLFSIQPGFSISAMALSYNGTFAVIAFYEMQPPCKGYVQVWERETGKVVNLDCLGCLEPIISVAISANEEFLILGQETGPTGLFNIVTQKLIMLTKVNEVGQNITCVALSPHGEYALAAYREYWDNKVTVWDTKTEEVLATFEVVREGIVPFVEFSSDGYSLLVVGSNGDLQVFDTLEGISLKKLITNYIYEIEWAGFSSDDQRIIASTLDGKQFVWEIRRRDTSWVRLRKKAAYSYLLKKLWDIALERERQENHTSLF